MRQVPGGQGRGGVDDILTGLYAATPKFLAALAERERSGLGKKKKKKKKEKKKKKKKKKGEKKKKKKKKKKQFIDPGGYLMLQVALPGPIRASDYLTTCKAPQRMWYAHRISLPYQDFPHRPMGIFSDRGKRRAVSQVFGDVAGLPSGRRCAALLRQCAGWLIRSELIP